MEGAKYCKLASTLFREGEQDEGIGWEQGGRAGCGNMEENRREVTERESRKIITWSMEQEGRDE